MRCGFGVRDAGLTEIPTGILGGAVGAVRDGLDALGLGRRAARAPLRQRRGAVEARRVLTTLPPPLIHVR